MTTDITANVHREFRKKPIDDYDKHHMESALTFQMVVIRFMTFNRYKQTLVQQLVTTVTVFHSFIKHTR